jgi:hypothetical protein
MNELLKQGYTMDEIIELFKKHGNDLRHVALISLVNIIC